MVESLMAHYFRPDDPSDLKAFVAADWIAALNVRRLDMIAEARRRWIGSQRRRPTIAEFLQFVDTVEREARQQYSPQGGRCLLPTEGEYSKLPEPERWSWHARMRAWRKKVGLSGPDPWGDNYQDPQLERAVEDEIGMASQRRWFGIPPAADQVRPNWRDIPAPQLTQAERHLFVKSTDAIMAEYLKNKPAVKRMPVEEWD